MTFIRPTPLALKLSKTRAGDWQHLGVNPDMPTKATLPKPVTAIPNVSKPPPEPKATPKELHEILFGDDD